GFAETAEQCAANIGLALTDASLLYLDAAFQRECPVGGALNLALSGFALPLRKDSQNSEIRCRGLVEAGFCISVEPARFRDTRVAGLDVGLPARAVNRKIGPAPSLREQRSVARRVGFCGVDVTVADGGRQHEIIEVEDPALALRCEGSKLFGHDLIGALVL